MRKFLVPAAAAALLATSALSFAAPQHVTGTVKTFDAKAMTLELADGAVYSLPAKFKNPGIKDGDHVSISWEKTDGKMLADQVKILK